jgi:hypothetical protein
MKVKTYQSHEEWLAARSGKVTGSKLKDVITKRGNTTKIGVYQLVADYLGIQDGSVDGRDRGHEFELEAIKTLSEQTGIDFKTDLVMWESDENPNMAYSPDGYTEDHTITAEAKCLSSAHHIQIIVEKKILAEHYDQMIQSFIVNEQQDTHYYISYDPRVTAKPFFIIKTERADVEELVEYYRQSELEILDRVKEICEELAF